MAVWSRVVVCGHSLNSFLNCFSFVRGKQYSLLCFGKVDLSY